MKTIWVSKRLGRDGNSGAADEPVTPKQGMKMRDGATELRAMDEETRLELLALAGISFDVLESRLDDAGSDLVAIDALMDQFIKQIDSGPHDQKEKNRKRLLDLCHRRGLQARTQLDGHKPKA